MIQGLQCSMEVQEAIDLLELYLGGKMTNFDKYKELMYSAKNKPNKSLGPTH